MLDKLILCKLCNVEVNQEFRIPVEYDEADDYTLYNHFIIDPDGLPWIRKGDELKWAPLMSWHWLLTHMDEIEIEER